MLEHRAQPAALWGRGVLALNRFRKRGLGVQPLFRVNLQVEQVRRDPGAVGPQAIGAARVPQCLLPIVALHAVGQKPPHAKEFCFPARQHRREEALRGRLVAGELRGLRRQQKRQRRLVQKRVRPANLAAGLVGVAGGDGDHAAGQGEVAAAAANCVAGPPDPARKSARETDCAPGRGDDQGDDRDGAEQDGDRRLDSVSPPNHRRRAGIVGEPGDEK